MLEARILIFQYRLEPALRELHDLRCQAVSKFCLLQGTGPGHIEVIADIIQLSPGHGIEHIHQTMLLWQFVPVQGLLALHHIFFHHLGQALSRHHVCLFLFHYKVSNPRFRFIPVIISRSWHQPKKSAIPSTIPWAAFLIPSSLSMSFSSLSLEINATSTSVAGISVCFTT